MMKKLTALLLIALLMMTCVTAGADDLITVTLSDEGMSFAAETGITAEGSVVTITRPGEYLVSGTLTDGRIVIDCEIEGKVTLQLNGVNITSTNGPAIHIVKCSPRAVISLVDASVNRLENGSELVLDADEEPNGVIFSKDDLTISGQGTLTVKAGAMDGIVSKDDLCIKDGNITVTAPRHAIRGKDSVEISGGVITVTAGKDGLRSTNKTKTDAGFISITGGEITIRCGDDALSYETACDISGAVITIVQTGMDD
ncbi:MAG: carbohydrate-binding domain-containing protein [Clostridia bacterium]|nr:carbohydrate-binding domain-containing protein [Clostridia bacterium]